MALYTTHQYLQFSLCQNASTGNQLANRKKKPPVISKRYFRRPLWVLLVVMLLATLISALSFLHNGKSTAAHAAGTTPSLVLSTDTIHPYQTITATGYGFAPNEQVILQLDGWQFVSPLTCDGSGTCTGRETVPAVAEIEGNYPLVGVGTNSGLSASVEVTLEAGVALSIVGPGAQKPESSAILKFGPGTPLALSGSAFAANETIQVYLGSLSGTHLGSATTDDSGTLYFYFTAPDNLNPGTYTLIVARTNQKPKTVQSHFEIIAPQITVQRVLHIGQSLLTFLRGFQALETVTISWSANGGQILGSLTVDWTGTSNKCAYQDEPGCIIPPSALPGTYTISAIGNSSGLKATTTVDVGPGIALLPSYGGAGTTITVNGGGFSPNETVNVYFQITQNGIVTTTTDLTGAFSVQLATSRTYKHNITYYVHAVNSSGTEHARAQFTFEPAQISLDQQNVTYGTPFAIYGNNFWANETVTIYWNYHQRGQQIAGTATADKFGTFTVNMTTPSDPNLGNVTVAAIGATSGLQATTTASEQGAVIVKPSQGPLGTTIHINTGGFDAHEMVTIRFGGMNIATASANASGAVHTTAVITINPDSNTIQAVGETSGLTFDTTFTIIPNLSINPTSGTSGTKITVTGQNFQNDNLVEIYWYDPSTGSSTRLTAVWTSGTSFTTTVIAPSGLISGNTYYVQAYNEGGPTVQAAFIAQ